MISPEAYPAAAAKFARDTPVPAEQVAAPGPASDLALGTKPVGTGPYRLVEWRQGSSMVLEANPTYHGGAPAVRRITIVFATDDNTRAQRVAAGEFDGPIGVAAPGASWTIDPAPAAGR